MRATMFWHVHLSMCILTPDIGEVHRLFSAANGSYVLLFGASWFPREGVVKDLRFIGICMCLK